MSAKLFLHSRRRFGRLAALGVGMTLASIATIPRAARAEDGVVRLSTQTAGQEVSDDRCHYLTALSRATGFRVVAAEPMTEPGWKAEIAHEATTLRIHLLGPDGRKYAQKSLTSLAPCKDAIEVLAILLAAHLPLSAPVPPDSSSKPEPVRTVSPPASPQIVLGLPAEPVEVPATSSEVSLRAIPTLVLLTDAPIFMLSLGVNVSDAWWQAGLRFGGSHTDRRFRAGKASLTDIDARAHGAVVGSH